MEILILFREKFCSLFETKYIFSKNEIIDLFLNKNEEDVKTNEILTLIKNNDLIKSLLRLFPEIDEIMKYFIFRKDQIGFNDYLASTSSFRLIIRQYEDSGEERRAGLKEQFLEAFEWYQRYLAFCKLLTDKQREFVRIKASHKIPPYSLLDGFEINEIYQTWLLAIANGSMNNLEEVSAVEFGKLLYSKRNERRYSRKELADIIGISQESMKAYENGTRTMPLDVYYKLKQLLDLKI